MARRLLITGLMTVLLVLTLPAAAQETDAAKQMQITLRVDAPPESYTAEDLYETGQNIARRLSGLGLTDALVQIIGANRIQVQFSTEADVMQIADTISQTAFLEIVDMRGLGEYVDEWTGRRILTDEQQRRVQGSATDEIASDEPDGILNPLTNQPFATVITGSGMKTVTAEYYDGQGLSQWYLQFELQLDAAEIFGAFTAEAARTQEPVGIVLDGVLLSAPRVQAQLTSGGIIAGNFTEQETRQLVLQLQSGALALPLSVESIDTVQTIPVGGS
jgi:preprotein translocase subunit SecD